MNTFSKDEFVGTTLFGFCNGFFGRDSYEDKVIIASGSNWIVADSGSIHPEFASFGENENMAVYIHEWSIEPGDDGF